MVGWGMFTAAFFLLPVTVLTPFTGTVDTSVLLAFAYVVIFGTVCSFVLYLSSVAYILPTEASIISAIEPLSSILFPFSSSASPSVSGSSSAWPSSSWPWQRWQENKGPIRWKTPACRHTCALQICGKPYFHRQ